MKYILDAAQMKEVDSYSINTVGIPSVVLMERAALSVTEQIVKECPDICTSKGIICVCGSGNNGADGLAVARQLYLRGYKVAVYLNEGRHSTEEYRIQLNIIRNLGIQYINDPDFSAYGVIVDALFGNGLSRELEGVSVEIVNAINKAHDNGAYVVAVDIPSGINATTGEVSGCAVKADATVTFGYAKVGQLLYPGAGYCGKLVVQDIGFADCSTVMKNTYIYEQSDILRFLPQRRVDSNKGSCGKALIIAGSEQYGGAAVLSSRAAYRMGAGLVRLITHKNNRDIVLNNNMECLIDTYEDVSCEDDSYDEKVKSSIEWADAVCIGPGLSKNHMAEYLVRLVTCNTGIGDKIDEDFDSDSGTDKGTDKGRKLLLDADALNIIAAKNIEYNGLNVVITPHIGEMSRLTGMSIAQIKKNPVKTAVTYAKEHNCVCVLKDARTIVTDGNSIYINVSGNDGMATGGSGDVLSGMITSLMAQGMDCFAAAKLGVYMHGLAGDAAAKAQSRYSMVAGDIINNISKIITE